MKPEELRERINIDELRYSASRSSGPGGQNVNKVNTKIELRFNIPSSLSLSEEEKTIILDYLSNRINTAGDLLIISQSSRSQLQNKKNAESTFFRLMSDALTPPAERKPTKPTHVSMAKRLDSKKKRGIIKSSRKKYDEKDTD
ncbi:MAG TPA: alternative ribosome rescue aminoacyl-tRNA hydrolase ArfB [Bacteroidales bacterium]|nr:alternative ribosome rescue aminoacyl-tRNA hydrolase ArfB [Bacteroidales bacterium]